MPESPAEPVVSAAVPVLEVAGLSKTYAGPQGALTVLRNVSLAVAPGEMVAIVGQSGAGKSTLLHLIGGLDSATSGSIRVQGREVTALKPGELAAYRNTLLGYVWQQPSLLPEFTAAENVAMPLLARAVPRADALRQAALWLERVGVAARAEHRSGELSGGEQGRVALARALVTGPALLLADEPTGNLDVVTAEAVFTMLQGLCRETATAVLLVTHHAAFAARAARSFELRAGDLHRLH